MGLTAGLRAFGIAALAAVSTLVVASPSIAAASSSTSSLTVAMRVVTIAEAQRGKPYVFGAAGPTAFDCSGLVRYAYLRAGVNALLGGGHSGYAMLAWGRAHHLVSGSNPQVGDVVIYGNGAHAAIYIGDGRVISALNPSQGIRITGLHALHDSVTGFIHTHLSGTGLSSTPSPVRTATSLKIVRPTAAKAKVRAKAAKPAAAKAATTVVARSYLNLRSAPSLSGRVLATVRPGDRLRVTGATTTSGRRWDHVAYGNRSFWVLASLVRAA